MTNAWLWSTTAASNATADGNLWSEGQNPDTVNNSSRDNMAAQAMFRKDTSGETATTGSANAYVLTLATTSLAALADGMKFSFRANFANTSTATLNVNSTGAKSIKKTNSAALASGDIESGGIYTVTYILSTDEYRLHATVPPTNFTLGASTSFVPTIAATSGTITTSSGTGQYIRLGKLVWFTMTLTITTNGTGAGALTATAPFTAAQPASILGRENALTGVPVFGRMSASSNLVTIVTGTPTYPATDGAIIIMSGMFEAA